MPWIYAIRVEQSMLREIIDQNHVYTSIVIVPHFKLYSNPLYNGNCKHNFPFAKTSCASERKFTMTQINCNV